MLYSHGGGTHCTFVIAVVPLRPPTVPHFRIGRGSRWSCTEEKARQASWADARVHRCQVISCTTLKGHHIFLLPHTGIHTFPHTDIHTFPHTGIHTFPYTGVHTFLFPYAGAGDELYHPQGTPPISTSAHTTA